MKASELIKELQKNIDKNGDREIYIECLDDTGIYSGINAIKPKNKIYTGKGHIKEKIFLLGEIGYGDFE
jgi:hypothetical protein